MDLVLATSNLHKLREFRDMLKHLKTLEVFSLNQFPKYTALPETASTFKENAIQKAEHAAKELNQLVLADDSGLVVPALKGDPGVLSRRYAGPHASDAENRKKLLEVMHWLSDDDRSAYFECVLALASPQGLIKCVSGTCEGFILREERGRNGFGYDSLFVKMESNKTFAELDENTKNKVSHRRKALEKLLPSIEHALSH